MSNISLESPYKPVSPPRCPSIYHSCQTLDHIPGLSIFDYADNLSIRVPASCGRGCHEGIFHNKGKPIQFSLFEPLYQSQFDSTLESRFARYLDERKAITWWHRVAARQRSEYYLRGWKRERVWPDFIAMAGQTEGKPHLLVFETKGGHLDNPDTDYKRRVFQTLENAFNVGSMTIRDGPARGTFKLIFSEDEFRTALANLESAYCV